MKKTLFDPCIVLIFASLFLRLVTIGFNHLLPEEAYYWNYATHLDFGYLDHPPMVALLIKFFTSIMGTHEFSVRSASLLCWLLMSVFSFKLTNLIQQGYGKYALLLVSLLPFFFIHSLIITPDLPLMACWSACLYYLYRVLVKKEPHAWYFAGFWLGLGLLSKYTAILLGLSTLVFLLTRKKAHFWFFKKDPYLAALLSLLVFSPVIYWNITHHWVSFAFQSTRRFHSDFYFSFHELLGLLAIFLTPLGLLGFLQLIKKSSRVLTTIDENSQFFIQVYTLVPLSFFGIFSLSHPIKFNWIGPALLALVPWLALMMPATPTDRLLKRNWHVTALALLCCYSVIIACVLSGRPSVMNRNVFNKYIAWGDWVYDVNRLANDLARGLSAPLSIVPMDSYNMASELNFYQAKLLEHRAITKTYPTIGSHIFGGNSLMFQYWDRAHDHDGQYILLISTRIEHFREQIVLSQSSAVSSIHEVWAHSQGQKKPVRKYYYQVLQITNHRT